MSAKFQAVALVLIGGLLLVPCTVAQTAHVDPAYQQSFEKWKAELVEGRQKNWLPLAGLFWLKPGENTFGTDSGNAVVFPKGPAKAGSFELNGTDVTLKLSPGTQATIQGKPVTTAKLEPDTSKDRTVVEMGSLRFHVIVRGKRIGIRLKDLESQAIHDYHGPFSSRSMRHTASLQSGSHLTAKRLSMSPTFWETLNPSPVQAQPSSNSMDENLNSPILAAIQLRACLSCSTTPPPKLKLTPVGVFWTPTPSATVRSSSTSMRPTVHPAR